jgi:hypothetical protein
VLFQAPLKAKGSKTMFHLFGKSRLIDPTLGARMQDGKLVELCGSTIPS